ncbi:hypothetical protein [Bacillus solitudinis]|uniref:hypothetical protein n=1 Tax=Bacillus solitudinis TaxID=2014074 RepID=UPI000C245CF9|nr:hypothetical protein [Bacillus solitudinis]
MKDTKKQDKLIPDFDKLSDRVIADPPKSSMFVMKTNLDSDNVEEDNPYFEGKEKDIKALRKFFEQG